MTPLDYAAKICYSSREVLQFTYDMAVKYKHKPGVYVEAGVAAGAQIIAMAAGAPNKTIYAFDSFQGIPRPSNKDNQMPGIRFLSKAEQKALPNPGEQVLESTGTTSVSWDDFWNHIEGAFPGMREELSIIGVEGWFEETLPITGCPEISILRLDGDLYNSTAVCLKYLYPKVIKGGLVIVDDWALPGCREAAYDYFTEMKGVFEWPLAMKYITDKNSTVAYWTK